MKYFEEKFTGQGTHDVTFFLSFTFKNGVELDLFTFRSVRDNIGTLKGPEGNWEGRYHNMELSDLFFQRKNSTNLAIAVMTWVVQRLSWFPFQL